jgi:TP901-1 family phage major tail protein
MAFLGRKFLLHLNITGNWVTVGGLKSTSMVFNSVVVDTTSTRSGGWREILNDFGNQSGTISGVGIFKNSVGEQYVRSAFFNPNLQPARIIQADGHYYSGNFKISKLEYAGEHSGAQTYNMTLESSGVVAYV